MFQLPYSPVELTLYKTDQMKLSLGWIEMWLTSNLGEVGYNQRQINLDSPRSVVVKFLILAPACNDLTLNLTYCFLTSYIFLCTWSISAPLNEVTWKMPLQIFNDKLKFSATQLKKNSRILLQAFILHSQPSLKSNLCPHHTYLHYPGYIK